MLITFFLGEVVSDKPDFPNVVFTDGCCHNNGKDNPNAGIGIYWGKDDSR